MQFSPESALKDQRQLFWPFATAINSLAILACAIAVIGFQTNTSPLDLGLLIAVPSAAILVGIWAGMRGQFCLAWGADAERLSLAPGFHALLFVIGIHVLQDQTLLDREFGIWTGVIGGAAATGLILWLDRPVKWACVPLTALVTVMAIWSLTQVANCLLDNGPSDVFRTKIGDKGYSQPACGGSVRFGYCTGTFRFGLYMSPGLYGLPNPLRVGSGMFYGATPGDQLCVTEHPGRFGARWFEFEPCNRGVTDDPSNARE